MGRGGLRRGLEAASALLLLFGAGCRSGNAPSTTSADAGPPALTVREDAGAPVLTDAKLDAYVRYQTALLGLWASQAKDAAEPRAKQREALKQRAQAEGRAREASGLSEAEVEAFEQLVSAVISRRALLQAANTDGLIAAHEKLLATLPSEAKPTVERQIEDLKATQTSLNALAEERVQYGDASVDRVLKREKELTRNWNRMLQIWAR